MPVQTVTATSMAFESPTTVYTQYGQNDARHVYVGAFTTVASDTPDSFLAWCVDIFQRTFFGSTATDFDRKTASAAQLAPKTALLNTLASQSLADVQNSLTSAAFQLAVWEIVNETSSIYDFTSGSFRATNASDGSIVLAQQWLDTLPNASAAPFYNVSILESASRQDLAVFTKVPVFADVPEPSSIAVMLAGLMGYALTRRKFSK